jgi:UDP-glucose 4-epimerase
MRVFITGGCGFIGTNLVQALNALKTYKVRVFDNESLGRREYLSGLETEFVQGDLRKRSVIESALENIDAVVHLAADTRVIDSIANPQHNVDVNVLGSLSLLDAMRARKITRLINASTGGAILGDAKPPVHEDMAPRPLSPYGASKLAVEGYCSAYSASYGLEALSLRFSNVYGPRSFHKGSVVAAFFKQILEGKELTIYGDGTQLRDFVFVQDICQGIINGLQSSVTGVIQLGSGQPTSINTLLDLMRTTALPRKFSVRYEPFRPGEVHSTYSNIDKAKREIDFQPKTSLSDGLARTWQWFLDRAL